MKRSICAIAVLALGLPLALAANDDLVSRQNDDDQWVLPGKNYSATRYSSLDDITADNVANLTQVWSFSTGALRGHEGQPLVVDSTMYVHSAYPNHVYAIDLTAGGLAHQVAVHAGAGRPRRAGRLLRSGPSRRELRRGPHPDDDARRTRHRARCRERRGAVERQERRPVAGRDDDDGRPRGQGQVHRGRLRRRVRHPRLGGGLRGRLGRAALEGLQHGPGRGRDAGAGLQRGQSPSRRARRRHRDVARRPLAERRRRHVGLVRLRPRPRPDLLLHGQSRDVEPDARARATTSGR